MSRCRHQVRNKLARNRCNGIWEKTRHNRHNILCLRLLVTDWLVVDLLWGNWCNGFWPIKNTNTRCSNGFRIYHCINPLTAGIWRRSSSAAFCRLKDLCRQADLAYSLIIWHAIHQSFVRTISCVRMLVRTFVYLQGYSPKRAYVRKCKNCAYISERYRGFVRTKFCVYMAV